MLTAAYADTRDTQIALTELGSQPDWELARRWIAECRACHPRCSPRFNQNEYCRSPVRPADRGRVTPNPLPSRLIDVGDNSKEPRLVTGVTSAFVYATLSYRRGGSLSNTLSTLEANLAQHLESVPLNTIPPTFRDAVIATRELGIPYLWIDELCIIQDSRDDWEEECSKMGGIYLGGRVNLCATMPTGPAMGFLAPRAPIGPSYTIEYREPGGNAAVKRANLIQCDDNDLEFPSGIDYPCAWELTESENASLINTSSWIQQEVALAPRTLYFGPYRIYYQCSQRTCFEDHEASIHETRKLRLHNFITKQDMVKPNDIGILRPRDPAFNFYALVSQFTTRRLARPSDRFPAIGGVAEWLLGGRADQYRAGVFRNSWMRGLSWYVFQPHRFVSPPQTYLAPTWSWASQNYAVRFVGQDINYGYDDDTLSIGDQRRYAAISQRYELHIEEWEVQTAGRNPYGGVIGGTIRGTGVVQTSTIDVVSADERPHYTGLHPVMRSHPRPILILRHPFSDYSAAVFYPDRPEFWHIFDQDLQSEVGGDDSGIEFVFLGYQPHTSRWTAMAVEPVDKSQPQRPGPGQYKRYFRIGLVDFWANNASVDNFVNWFAKCERQKIEIV